VLVRSHSTLLTVVSYAELGCAIPLNGGAYAYLSHVYGELWACLFSWTMIFILKPVGAAAVALLFGEYVMRVLQFSVNADDTGVTWTHKLAALACVWVVIGINIKGTREGTTVNTIFTVIKILSVASIAVIGMAMLGSLLCYR